MSCLLYLKILGFLGGLRCLGGPVWPGESKMSGLSSMPEMFLKAMKSEGRNVITGATGWFSLAFSLITTMRGHVLSY